jgi:hypothetical protein
MGRSAAPVPLTTEPYHLVFWMVQLQRQQHPCQPSHFIKGKEVNSRAVISGSGGLTISHARDSTGTPTRCQSVSDGRLAKRATVSVRCARPVHQHQGERASDMQ